ncbi:MAG: TIGR04282 family arsenosugar biosynthesis glycosyltransferase [Rhizobacter sp.]|nr:TIGR04282 family arsenosugar biosynthesis glycosyltransferase [Ferruginibacter sp.]
MKEKALIIFVRKPEKGKVKTRLAATLGETKALSIYVELLHHTRRIATASIADKFVFYADEIPPDDDWSNEVFKKRLQADDDLGGKMKNAFTVLFEAGYSNVIIIGSDCFELSAAIIEQAFELLQHKDVVIGPANDGGYYLLGMKKLHPCLFENKQWSTEHVLRQTTDDLERENISYTELVRLTDVDTEEDWMKTRKV